MLARSSFFVVAAALLAWASALEASTWSITFGEARTRMQPSDPEERSHVEFVSRRGKILGVRGEFGITRTFDVRADLRWVPRGGGVSFRQTYGYYGDYLEFSPRLAVKTPGTRAWGSASLGPAVSVRVRQRNSDLLSSSPDGHYPEFGSLSRVELGALATAGITVQATRRVRVWAEANYNQGLTNMHNRGSAGTSHDPHVYDFLAKSRTVGVVLGLGVSCP